MTETVAAKSAKRRRRPSSLAITGILALIMALLAGGGVILARYQPLVRGSSGLHPPGKEVDSTDPSDDRPTFLVQYVDGQTVTFGFSIRNSGRWGVTIVGLGASTAGMLDRFTYKLDDTGFTTDNGPFKPFALGP